MREMTSMQDKRETTVEENMMLFIRHGLCAEANRTTQNNRKRSADTFHKAVNEVADYILSIEQSYFIPPPPNSVGPHPKLAGNTKMRPYFDEFEGAIDGTHIPCIIKDDPTNVWRNRKGLKSQNVLVYIDFDMIYLYILAGWEGSAHDATVMADALTKGFPRSRKKLVDAAYAHTHEHQKPYPLERYHLGEWGPDELRPQNYREL